VPWLNRLVAGVSLLRPGSIHVGFVVDKVAPGQVFLRVLRFSPVNIIPPLLHIHLSPPHEVCYSSDQAAQYHNLGPKLGASFLTRHIGWKQNQKVKFYAAHNTHSLRYVILRQSLPATSLNSVVLRDDNKMLHLSVVSEKEPVTASKAASCCCGYEKIVQDRVPLS
jgi:hypothetical protein